MPPGEGITVRSVSEIDRARHRRLLRAFFGGIPPQVAAMTGEPYEVEDIVAQALAGHDGYLGPASLLLVAERHGGLVGAVSAKRLRPDAGEIKNLYVRPEARGSGLGRWLAVALIAQARAMGLARLFLDTVRFMTAARRLFHELGFVEIPRYPDGFNPPELGPHLRHMRLDLR